MLQSQLGLWTPKSPFLLFKLQILVFQRSCFQARWVLDQVLLVRVYGIFRVHFQKFNTPLNFRKVLEYMSKIGPLRIKFAYLFYSFQILK